MHQFEYFFKTNDILEIKDNFKRFEDVKSEMRFSDNAVEKPAVTIAIPTYKNPTTLYEALESALKQEKAPAYNIIIVNNDPGEDDEIIKKLKLYSSGRIVYYRNMDNIGQFGNWMRCLELSSSDYVVLLHADDLLVPDTLSTLWEVHQKVEPTAAIIGREHNLVNGVFEEYQPQKILRLFRQKKIYRLNKCSLYQRESENGCASLLYRPAMKEIGGWNPDCFPGGDRIMFVLYQVKYPVYRINHPIRINRVETNDSFKYAKLFPASNYYSRTAIVDKYFKGNKMLKYLIYLSSVSFSSTEFGVKPIKKLNPFERFLLRIESTVCLLSHQL